MEAISFRWLSWKVASWVAKQVSVADAQASHNASTAEVGQELLAVFTVMGGCKA